METGYDGDISSNDDASLSDSDDEIHCKHNETTKITPDISFLIHASSPVIQLAGYKVQQAAPFLKSTYQVNKLLHAAYKGDLETIKSTIESSLYDNPVYAAYTSDITHVRHVLCTYPSIRNIRSGYNRETVLHAAVKQGSIDLVKLGLSCYVDADIVDRLTKKPLHRALEYDYHNITQLILDHTKNADQRDAYGRTPVYIATVKGNLAVLQKLLWRSDVNIFQKLPHSGTTLFTVAQRHNHHRVKEALEAACHIS